VLLDEETIWSGIGRDFVEGSLYEASIPADVLTGRAGLLSFVLHGVGDAPAEVILGSIDEAIEIPDEGPRTTANPLPAPNEHGWNREAVTVHLSATGATGNPADVREILFTMTGATVQEGIFDGANGSLEITHEGVTVLQYRARSVDGTEELPQSIVVKIDRPPPNVIFGPPSPPANLHGWHRVNVLMPYSITDVTSGPGSDPGSVVITGEGTGLVQSLTVYDLAGNDQMVVSPAVNIDRTPPILTCTSRPHELFPPTRKLVPVEILLTASDERSGALSPLLNNLAIRGGVGNMVTDISGWLVGTSDTNGWLRALTDGQQDRHYDLQYRVLDLAFNSTSCLTTVSVPHPRTQSKGCPGGCP
jgi:hypothetical protein